MATRNGKPRVSNRRQLKNDTAKKQAGYLNYDSVQYSPNRKYIFAPLYTDAKDELDIYSRTRMLQLSRDHENNFPVYKQLIDTVSRISVGKGINPIPATSKSDYNDLATFTWNQWANNRMCTVDDSGNWNQVLLLVAERLVVDGEVFVLFVKSANGYPQLQVIDPMKVSTDDKEGNVSVRDGIQYNASGKPISYRVKTDSGFVTIQPENVCHIFDKKRVGQGRGYPWAQSAFPTMQDVKDTYSLEMQGVKVSSIFAAQLLDKGNGAPDNAGILAPRSKQPQPSLNNGEQVPNNTNAAEVEKVTLGGKVLDLNSKEIKLIESNRPTPAFGTLREMLHREVCQAVGIPYEVAYDPENINNSSNGVVTELTQAFASEMQQILISSFCNRVYSWVISVQLPLEDVRPLGNENPFTARWNTPKKFGRNRNDMTNQVLLLNNKLITIEKFYHENYGEDWLPNIKQRIDEEAQIQAYAKSKDVDMSKVVYGMGTIAGAAQESDGEDKPQDKTPTNK